MKKYLIYKHLFPNNKVYIGQTYQKPNYRWKKGESYAKTTIEKISNSLMGHWGWNKGRVCTKETVEKMSLAIRGEKNPFYGKHHNKETINKIRLKNSKPVLQLTLTGEIVKEFPSLKELGFDKINKKKILRKSGEYFYMYKSDYCIYNVEELIQKYNSIIYSSVIQYSLDEDFIREYSSLREASAITGINRSSITKCCQGKGHTAGNYKWRYKI